MLHNIVWKGKEIDVHARISNKGGKVRHTETQKFQWDIPLLTFGCQLELENEKDHRTYL